MENQKKLFIFIPSIEDGGVEKNLYIIANYLTNHIKEIFLITFDKKKIRKFNKKIKFITPKFKLGKNHKRPFKYLICLLLLIKEIIKSNRNGLIFSWQANIYAIILCFFFRVKIISRSNSSPSGWSKNYFKNLIFSFFLKKANTVIVNSLSFKKEIDRKFKLNSRLIYNPFNFLDIKNKSNNKLNDLRFNHKILKIINIGRLTDQKDQITLIKGAELALKEINLKVFIICKGTLKNKLKQYVEKNNLTNNIYLLGYKNNPYNYLKKSDIFILTSKFEGSPNVIIESQFLKKYVISTDCPTGPREILKNGKLGDLVKIGDYKSIARLLINFNKKKINRKIQDAYNSLKIYDLNNNCSLYLEEIKKYL
jgi:glycosyltransferase involved in cell wall biosynthesis